MHPVFAAMRFKQLLSSRSLVQNDRELMTYILFLKSSQFLIILDHFSNAHSSLSDHLTGDLHAIDEVSVDRLSASSDLESYDDNGYSSNVLSKLVNEIELPV